MKQLLEFEKPQNIGYRNFFTATPNDNTIQPMQYARASNNRNAMQSEPAAINLINKTYMPGPMHFGSSVKYDKEKMFFDIDLKSAYPTWLLNYKRGSFNYKVGGEKRYFNKTSGINREMEGLRSYKLSFTVKTNGRENSRIYRHWFLKTTKIPNLLITNEYISGHILIPNINGLVNQFLDDLYMYDCVVEIDSMIIATGYNNVYINEDKLREAMLIKNDKRNPLSKKYKMILNSSTGFLSIADKQMYYTMVNHVRSELFRLMRAIDRLNRERPDLELESAAANTDGITVYASKEAYYSILTMIEEWLNPYSVFKFDLKDAYSWDDAKFTKNDIRRLKN